jgi:hypothetical protein
LLGFLKSLELREKEAAFDFSIFVAVAAVYGVGVDFY